jgi:hypothetical protein
MAEAILDASVWSADPANTEALADVLSTLSDHGVTTAMIAQILTPRESRKTAPAAMGLRLDPAALVADRAQALWILAQMIAAGQTADRPGLAEAAVAVYRPDLGPPASGPAEVPQCFDNIPFAPDDLRGYLAALGVSGRAEPAGGP